MAQPKIFVSHSKLDTPFAFNLVEDLNAAGGRAWMDVNDLGAGDFQDRISVALADCEWFLLVLTRNALASDWVRQEVNAANRLKNLGKIRDLIFIQASPVNHEELPALWGVFHIFDAMLSYETALDHTLEAVGLLPTAKQAVSASPYIPPARTTTIVVADDDPQLLRLVRRNLELDGYEVLAASDGQEALDLIETRAPTLVLLDIMMSKLDGFTVLQRVREFSRVPIIIVTARGQDQDKIRGFDLGADDYLTKPFRVDELLARVQAVLRRSQPTARRNSRGLHSALTVGELTVDFAQQRVTMRGREIILTPMEYLLLASLAQNVGRVITADLLLKHIWGPEYVGETHLLQVNMSRLRRKIEPDSVHPRYILTKTGEGYLLANQPS